MRFRFQGEVLNAARSRKNIYLFIYIYITGNYKSISFETFEHFCFVLFRKLHGEYNAQTKNLVLITLESTLYA